MTSAALIPRRERIAPPVRHCPLCLSPMTLIVDGAARCAAGHTFRVHLEDLHTRRDRLGAG